MLFKDNIGRTNYEGAISYVHQLQVELGMVPLLIALFDCTVKFKEWWRQLGLEKMQANLPSC